MSNKPHESNTDKKQHYKRDREDEKEDESYHDDKTEKRVRFDEQYQVGEIAYDTEFEFEEKKGSNGHKEDVSDDDKSHVSETENEKDDNALDADDYHLLPATGTLDRIEKMGPSVEYFDVIVAGPIQKGVARPEEGPAGETMYSVDVCDGTGRITLWFDSTNAILAERIRPHDTLLLCCVGHMFHRLRSYDALPFGHVEIVPTKKIYYMTTKPGTRIQWLTGSRSDALKTWLRDIEYDTSNVPPVCRIEKLYGFIADMHAACCSQCEILFEGKIISIGYSLARIVRENLTDDFTTVYDLVIHVKDGRGGHEHEDIRVTDEASVELFGMTSGQLLDLKKKDSEGYSEVLADIKRKKYIFGCSVYFPNECSVPIYTIVGLFWHGHV